MISTNPVFILGRFRSGTTLVWNILKSTNCVWTYYEPCHDNLAAHICADSAPMGSHRGVESYWDEYQWIKEELVNQNNKYGISDLIVSTSENDSNIKKYFDWLIENTPDSYMPCLQLNRADFRIPWLKDNYPNSKIIYIWRNPRDQWLSMIKGYEAEAENNYFLNTGYDLLVWQSVLRRYLPFEKFYKSGNSYHVHYLIWRVALEIAKKNADLTLNLEEDLWKSGSAGVSKLLDLIGLDANPSELVKLISPSTRKYRTSSKWFQIAEEECDQALMSSGVIDSIRRGEFKIEADSDYESLMLNAFAKEISSHRDVIVSLSGDRGKIRNRAEVAEKYSKSLEIALKEKDQHESALCSAVNNYQEKEQEYIEVIKSINEQVEFYERKEVDTSKYVDSLLSRAETAEDYAKSIVSDLKRQTDKINDRLIDINNLLNNTRAAEKKLNNTNLEGLLDFMESNISLERRSIREFLERNISKLDGSKCIGGIIGSRELERPIEATDLSGDVEALIDYTLRLEKLLDKSDKKSMFRLLVKKWL